MRLYVAGPMSGIADSNFPAFREAASHLRGEGHDVESPVEMDEAEGFEGETGGDVPSGSGTWARFLLRDLEVISRPDVEAVVVLPGWEKSGGARHETRWARSLGKPILTYPSLRPVSEGEVRVVNAVTGGAKGRKSQRFELLPWEALGDIAEVYAFGADKYEDHNWLRGYDWSLSFGAMERHLAAFWSGEDMDPESGLSHVAHAGFHVLALLVFMRRFRELDDRPTVAPA